jgi:hypothetical protein
MAVRMQIKCKTPNTIHSSHGQKAAVTISTLPEQTHNNLCWNEIRRNKKPECSHNIIINNSELPNIKMLSAFTN